MYHNIYDRVRGAWWGAVTAQSFLNQPLAEAQTLDLFDQSWLTQRQKVATLLLRRELSIQDLQQLLADLARLDTSLQHNSSLLSLLPLIIFPANKPSLQLENIIKSNLESVNEPTNNAINRDILGWKYLLTIALNNRLDLVARKQVIEEVLKHYLTSSDRLADKLRLVSQGIENGSSLSLIVEQLSPLDGLVSTAIALAWYCFATTPDNFKLSILRASLVSANLAWLTTALTGTLSGAYNGMAEISAYGRTDGKNPQEQLEQCLCQKLFQDWLGVYADGRQDIFYSSELNAIAPPGLIQPRQSLKIISQVSRLKKTIRS